jgi:hypothetical protein
VGTAGGAGPIRVGSLRRVAVHSNVSGGDLHNFGGDFRAKFYPDGMKNAHLHKWI